MARKRGIVIMKQGLLIAGLAVLLAAPAAAQRRGWQAAQCDLSTGHYLVNSGVLYLRNASTTRFADQRTRDLRDAHRVLTQALDQGRDDDPAVWYYLGRYYVFQDDLAGADSAFDRAAQMAPGCADDINQHRRNMWVPTINQGVQLLQAGQTAEAKAAFRSAIAIYDTEPTGMYYLAQIFANEGTRDSAVYYYRWTIRASSAGDNAANEQFVEIRRNSTFNVARLYHMGQQYDSAVAWYGSYRTLDPNDPQALTGMAQALADAGQQERALALYDSVLARAADIPVLDVFATGVVLFRGQRHQRAAQAFEAGLERSPYYRDALFNLANTYLSLSDGLNDAAKRPLGERMTPVALRLLAVDPANQASMRLLAASYQLRGMPDSTLAVLERAQARPFDVTISMFQLVGPNQWELRGLITNTGDAAVNVGAITFEFLTEAGEVVSTQTVPAQSLAEAAPIGLRVQGEGIAAWRYRIGT